MKVFGFTASNGKKLNFVVPTPFTAEVWAPLVKSKLYPFLKKNFPNRRQFTILLDGEKVLHAPAAKRAMEEKGIRVFPHWPKYSPDVKPQENVWPGQKRICAAARRTTTPLRLSEKQCWPHATRIRADTSWCLGWLTACSSSSTRRAP